MSDEMISKPYWKIDVTKTVTYNTGVYIRSWKEPTIDEILKAIDETVNNRDWCENDFDYDYENIKPCEEKEANEYKVYDVNPGDPVEKVKVEYDPNQIVMGFIDSVINKEEPKNE